MSRCKRCPVEGPCFADRMGLAAWCEELERWRSVILFRSIEMQQHPLPAARDYAREASECPAASEAWDGCACVDRTCGRHNKVVSAMDCLLCVAEGVDP